MAKQDTVALVLRLMGVYLLAVFIPEFGVLITPARSDMMMFARLHLPLTIGISLVLILASRSLARWLTPAAEDSALSSSLSLRDIQAVAFSVVGVLIFAKAAYGVTQMLVGPPFKFPLSIGYVVQMILGLGLFLQSRGLADFWQRLQKTRPMKKATPSYDLPK